MPNVKNLCLSCMTNNLQNGKCSVCGAVETELWAAPHHLKPRTLLAGKYLVGKVLGEGGFGITYVGWDTVLSMKIAVKEYYPNGFVTREASHDSTVRSFSGEKGAYYEKGRGQFMEEAQRLARFFGLPGIVSVKDFFTENGTAYIVMEFVEGATLKKVLGNMGERMPEAHVLEIMKPLVRSLAHMHKSGVIHRDIKPDNIMLQPDGSVKLIDFGAARDADTDGKRTAAVMSHGYAPEEQYDPNRSRQGPWTDVYSLCATIFRAIEGHTPPDAITRLRKDTFAGFTVPVSENTRRVVTKGLALAPKDRWHNLDALAVELYPQTGMDFAAHTEEQMLSQASSAQYAPASDAAQSVMVAEKLEPSPIDNYAAAAPKSPKQLKVKKASPTPRQWRKIRVIGYIGALTLLVAMIVVNSASDFNISVCLYGLAAIALTVFSLFKAPGGFPLPLGIFSVAGITALGIVSLSIAFYNDEDTAAFLIAGFVIMLFAACRIIILARRGKGAPKTEFVWVGGKKKLIEIGAFGGVFALLLLLAYLLTPTIVIGGKLIKFSTYSNGSRLRITYDDIRNINALKGKTNLTHLILSWNDITDLTPLAGLTNLTELDLRSNNITDLTPLAGLTNLTELDLWDNDITDLTPLSGLTSLTELDLRNNDLTQRKIDDLRKTLPDCDIIVNYDELPPGEPVETWENHTIKVLAPENETFSGVISYLLVTIYKLECVTEFLPQETYSLELDALLAAGECDYDVVIHSIDSIDSLSMSEEMISRRFLNFSSVYAIGLPRQSPFANKLERELFPVLEENTSVLENGVVDLTATDVEALYAGIELRLVRANIDPYRNGSDVTLGNTSGNLVNGGLAVELDEILYFCDPANDFNLYSMDSSGTKKRIDSGSCSHLNALGNALYYLEGGRISVYIPESDEGAILSYMPIENTGINTLVAVDRNDTPVLYFSAAAGGVWEYKPLDDIENTNLISNVRVWQTLTYMGDYLYFREYDTESLHSLNILTGELRDYDLHIYPHAVDGFVYGYDSDTTYRIDPYTGAYEELDGGYDINVIDSSNAVRVTGSGIRMYSIDNSSFDHLISSSQDYHLTFNESFTYTNRTLNIIGDFVYYSGKHNVDNTNRFSRFNYTDGGASTISSTEN